MQRRILLLQASATWPPPRAGSLSGLGPAGGPSGLRAAGSGCQPMRPAPRAWAPAPLCPGPQPPDPGGSSCAEATAAAPEGCGGPAGSAAGGPGRPPAAPPLGPPPLRRQRPPERPAAAGARPGRRGEERRRRGPQAFGVSSGVSAETRSPGTGLARPSNQDRGVNPGCRLGADPHSNNLEPCAH